MHLHILGICGTFMGGVAALAREAGHTVTGCDAGVYPPMSDQLRALGIHPSLFLSLLLCVVTIVVVAPLLLRALGGAATTSL